MANKSQVARSSSDDFSAKTPFKHKLNKKKKTSHLSQSIVRQTTLDGFRWQLQLNGKIILRIMKYSSLLSQEIRDTMPHFSPSI